ncbi:MAG TPA: hypothetical protein PK557_07950, partial [Paludibacteraceae bacterium]|nr:hypothetical protein [Paludibacteraceae bacterium]
MSKIHWLFLLPFVCHSALRRHSARSAVLLITSHYQPKFALSSIIGDDIAQCPFFKLKQFKNGRNF